MVQIIQHINFNAICFAFAFCYRILRINKHTSSILIGPQEKTVKLQTERQTGMRY
jgi:hypothetical protein